MQHVALGGTRALSYPVRTALAAAGWRIVSAAAPTRIVNGANVDDDEAQTIRDFVLAGGRLLMLGEGGPLLARLQLTRLMPPMDAPVSGVAEPVQDPFEAIALNDVSPVTGAGYALLRVDDQVVGVGGPRGAGQLAYFADLDPPPALVLTALNWLTDRA